MTILKYHLHIAEVLPRLHFLPLNEESYLKRGKDVPIRLLLEATPFGPEECAAIAAAYAEVLLLLRMKRGVDPEREEEIARKVIALAQEGFLDKKRLAMETVKRLVH